MDTSSRRGFTLIEVLVVIAIIAVLVGLLVPAVQKVRESSNAMVCRNNLKQLLTATHAYHNDFKMLPTYNGIASKTNTTQASNTHAVYGGWFVHLLPYVEQVSLYNQIAGDVAKYTNTGGTVTAPGGTLISPAVAAQYVPPARLVSPAIPATYNLYAGSLQWVNTTTANGYTISTQQWVPPKTPDPGTNVAAVYDYTGCTYVPATPAVYGPPGPPVNGYVGLWNPTVRTTVFPILLCPSESTNIGTVYNGAWGATNYLANWNAFTTGNATKGYQAPPGNFSRITDGLSNTIFFAEAYAVCEGKGRTALLPWHNGGGGYSYGGVHNFGLTYGLGNNQITISGQTAVTVANANGFPNPSTNLNFYFQIRPDPVKAGVGGCDSMTVQTPHTSMNIALGDGSVRNVSAACAPTSWLALMLPNDGLIAEDY